MIARKTARKKSNMSPAETFNREAYLACNARIDAVFEKYRKGMVTQGEVRKEIELAETEQAEKLAFYKARVRYSRIS